jgi:hydrogenase maturation protein HypF
VGPMCLDSANDVARLDNPEHRSLPAEGTYIADWEPMVREILADRRKGESMARVSARFHNALVRLAVDLAAAAGCGQIVLTGGCFQNALLHDRACDHLRKAGYIVYTHQQVPPGDGGIALGQIFVAAQQVSSLRRSAS